MREEKIELEILGLSPSQLQGSTSFALILGEREGKRRLPIIIGMFEAQAIAIEVERITPNRPMTHDLFKSFAERFDFSLQEVLISNLKEGVFYAKIIGDKHGKRIEIDARPSDAIAIALRFGIAIYVYRFILHEAGIEVNDGEEIEEKAEEGNPAIPFGEKLKNMSTKGLKKLLEKTLEREEYEKAAKIRDEISKRN